MEGKAHAEGELRSPWGVRIREGFLEAESISGEEILG